MPEQVSRVDRGGLSHGVSRAHQQWRVSSNCLGNPLPSSRSVPAILA
jgi:hypothetical protein